MSLIAAMVVKDEADRYLDEVLIGAKKWADKIIVLDDHSTDDTPGICEDHGCTVYTHDAGRSIFQEMENKLREYLWRRVLPRECRRGDWVLSLDADELLQPNFKDYKDKLLSQTGVNTYSVQIYEAWGDRHKIRIDRYWNPTGKYTPILTRWLPQVNYRFPLLTIHTGRIPMNSPGPTVPCGFNLLHLGWADSEDHQRKYDRYMEMDKEPHPVMVEHYASILQEPTLMEWIF